jgi:[protein-PII] uridylyltransferase
MTTGAKQRCKDEQAEIREHFLATGQPAPVLKRRTALMDETVLEAFGPTLSQVMPEGVALMAVGGYGRRELFPHSDIDLIVLVRRALEAQPQKDALSELLRLLWDAGLRVSQSVRTMDECCSVIEGNFELTISLLDHRLLGGDRALYGQFRERFSRFLVSERRDLMRRLCRLTRSRHARHHETIYRLEPDVKEHPGGLRDLQTIRWLRLLREAGDVQGSTPESIDLRAAELLYSIRCFLHYRANRDANQLTFEAQDDLTHAPFSSWNDPAEWMQAYFRHGRSLWRAVCFELEASESQDRSLLANFRDWRSRLSNAEFTVSRDRVFLKNPHGLEIDPELPLRLFLFIGRHGVPLAMETERRIEESLPSLAKYYLSPRPVAPFWREFFALPKAVQAIRAMHDTGFLSALMPEWERIEHRVTRDFYHQYTVDEHTLVALDVLSSVAEAKDPATARYAELLTESADEAWLLRLAILLHDMGKGSGRDHSEEAVRLAGVVLERMGFDAADADTVAFLIGHHLYLSSMMQSRDLDDPATARAAAHQLKTIERLRLLTLLTYADISAVNSTAMSPWRMEQLWRLYRLTARELTGSLTTERIGTEPSEAFTKASPDVREFLDGLPSRYLWTHTLAEAEAHTALYRRSKDAGFALQITRREGIYHISIVAADRPFLFASIAGALSSFGLNILKAEAFANRRGSIVDSFTFADPGRTLDLNPPELERLRVVLGRVVLGEVRAEDLLKYRPPKPAPSRLGVIIPGVSVDNEVSPVATVCEVIAQDRPGLLYDLAAAISRAGCNIEVVLVDTEAHKAIDVFHVTESGAKLEPNAAESLKDMLLLACRSQ